MRIGTGLGVRLDFGLGEKSGWQMTAELAYLQIITDVLRRFFNRLWQKDTRVCAHAQRKEEEIRNKKRERKKIFLFADANASVSSDAVRRRGRNFSWCKKTQS